MKDNGKEVLGQLRDARTLLGEAKKTLTENDERRWAESVQSIIDDVTDQIGDIERVRDDR